MSGPTFNTIFMVMVRVRVISGCDVTLNISTAVRIKLQIVLSFFSYTTVVGENFHTTGRSLIRTAVDIFNMTS